MREKNRSIIEKDVFNISIKELEEGERPGWRKEVQILIEGQRVTMKFDVWWSISKWSATWGIIKMKLLNLYRHGS